MKRHWTYDGPLYQSVGGQIFSLMMMLSHHVDAESWLGTAGGQERTLKP